MTATKIKLLILCQLCIIENCVNTKCSGFLEKELAALNKNKMLADMADTYWRPECLPIGDSHIVHKNTAKKYPNLLEDKGICANNEDDEKRISHFLGKISSSDK